MLGEADFAQRVLSGRRLNEQEQAAARKLRRPASWDQVRQASEAIRGEAWDRWAERHGDWGRDGAIYAAVQAVKRFGEAMAKDHKRQRFISEVKRHLSHI